MTQVPLTPLPFTERLALKLLRRFSPRWRARTELFYEPYRQWTDWQSGLGDAAHLLYSLVRMTNPVTIVEIGSARGYSTCAMALACAENGRGKVHAIDPHILNEWTDVGTGGHTLHFLKQRLSDYQLEPFCQVLNVTSSAAARDWKTPIDLLFIDGDHTLAGVKLDFESFAPWVGSEGLVLVHDSMWERAQPWTAFRGESWFREEMGVPQYLRDLQSAGYQAVSFGPVPGLTIMHSQPGIFDLLKGRQKRA